MKGLEKMVKTNRRAISIVLAVLMAFSALFVGTTSASAAGTAQANSATLTINGKEYSNITYLELKKILEEL